MLLVDPLAHPDLKRLDDLALSRWNSAVARCAVLRTDILAAGELPDIGPEIVGEWERVGVAQKLPYGHCRLLGRGTLWDYE